MADRYLITSFEKDKRRMYMKTIFTGFHQDKNKEWVVDLSFGHSKHFRHNPPLQIREWVTSPQVRNTYIVFKLECRLHSHKELD